MTTADGFVIRHGLVQYKPYQLRKYSRDGLCEICGMPPYSGGKPTLLFDHCHDHGWVRGLLCNVCNDQVAFIENGWRRIINKWVSSRFPEYRLNCPDCRDSEVSSAA